MQLSIKKSAPVLPTPELIRLPGKPINHLEQVFNYEKYNAWRLLFDKKDTKENRRTFLEWMQHEN